jgi:hypothetical protein
MAQAALVLQAISGIQGADPPAGGRQPGGAHSGAHACGPHGSGMAMQMPTALPDLLQLPPRVRAGQADPAGAAGEPVRQLRSSHGAGGRPPLPPSLAVPFSAEALRHILPGWQAGAEAVHAAKLPRISLQLHMPATHGQLAGARATPEALAALPTLSMELPAALASSVSELLQGGGGGARLQAAAGGTQVQLTAEQLQQLLAAAHSAEEAGQQQLRQQQHQQPGSPFAQHQQQPGSPFAQHQQQPVLPPPQHLPAIRTVQMRSVRASPVLRSAPPPAGLPPALQGRQKSLLGLAPQPSGSPGPASPFAAAAVQQQAGAGHPVVHVNRVRARKGGAALAGGA